MKVTRFIFIPVNDFYFAIEINIKSKNEEKKNLIVH